jgi:hypothetical protein
MSTPAAVATNAAAVANLADALHNWGLSDPQERAEHLIRQLTADGWRPIDPPPTLRGPQSTDAGRAAARELYEQTRRTAREGVR